MTNSTPAYEWIFSGIGVAALSWLGAWLYRRRQREPKSEHSKVNISDSIVVGPVAGRDISIGTYVQHGVPDDFANDEYRATPTSTDIAAAIKKVPFYLRESTANSYSGVKVHWTAQVKSLVMVRDGIATLSFGGSDDAWPYIIVKVKLDDYPVIKTIHGGEPAELIGTIDWVQENTMIHLKDVKIKFLPFPQADKPSKQISDS